MRSLLQRLYCKRKKNGFTQLKLQRYCLVSYHSVAALIWKVCYLEKQKYKLLINTSKSPFSFLSTCSEHRASLVSSRTLTHYDSWRWNRNFAIKHLHKGEMTFDQKRVWCFDMKFASEGLKQRPALRVVNDSSCQRYTEVKILLGNKHTFNPAP